MLWRGHNVGELLSCVVGNGPLRHVTDNVEEIPPTLSVLVQRAGSTVHFFVLRGTSDGLT